METCEIRYTTSARKFLRDRMTRFEEQFRSELTEFMEGGEGDDLLFHSMEFEGCFFVGAWCDEGWLLVDTAHEEESEIRSGPHRGEKMIIPRPDSK